MKPKVIAIRNSYYIHSLFCACLLFLLDCLLSTRVVAGTGLASPPTPDALFKKLVKASLMHHYDGIFVHHQGRQIDTMRIIRKADKHGGSERLIALTGRAMEVIHDKDNIYYFYPDTKQVLHEQGQPNKLLHGFSPHSISHPSPMYRYEVGHGGRVAGRSTWTITITPRDQYRYEHQLWLDKQVSLLLKSQTRNLHGQVLEQVIFTQIDILDNVADTLLKPAFDTESYAWKKRKYTPHADQQARPTWEVAWVPQSFSIIGHYRQSRALNGHVVAVDHILFSDGLATVSIFIEKKGSQPGHFAHQGASKKGGLNIYSTLRGNYHVTAVGEVPSQTVRQMAMSVKRPPTY